MSKTLDSATQRLRVLLDAHDLTKAVVLRVDRNRIYLGRKELPGPFSADEIDESVRVEPIASGDFGLSVKRHTGRWEKTPHSGTLEAVVEVICTQMQHLVAPW